LYRSTRSLASRRISTFSWFRRAQEAYSAEFKSRPATTITGPLSSYQHKHVSTRAGTETDGQVGPIIVPAASASLNMEHIDSPRSTINYESAVLVRDCVVDVACYRVLQPQFGFANRHVHSMDEIPHWILASAWLRVYQLACNPACRRRHEVTPLIGHSPLGFQ